MSPIRRAAALTCWTLVIGGGGVPLASGEITHVLHVTVDGLRGDLVKGLLDSNAATYPTFSRLRSEGASTFNARCDFDYSETLPNHCGVVTGRPVIDPPGTTGVAHGYTSNGYTGTATTGDSLHKLGTATLVYKVSTFDTVHDRGLSTALYGGKARMNLFVHSYNATKGRADTIGADNGPNKIDFASASDLTGSSSLATAVAATITAGTLRNYTFIHFTDTDTGSTGGGHTVGWGTASWNNAVKDVDGFLGTILNALAAAPATLQGKVALVLTADHGGGGGGSGPGATPDRNHGDPASILNHTVPLFIWGPGIPSGIEAHRLFQNRFDPLSTRPTGSDTSAQPLRNTDSGNIAMALLGLPPIEGSYFVPEFRHDPELTLSATEVTVTWPSYLKNHTLQSTADLATGSWTEDLVPPVEINGRWSRTLTLPNAPAYYWRLTPPR